MSKANALAKPTSSATVADVKKYLASASSLLNQEEQKLEALPKPSTGGNKFSAVYAQQASDGKKLAAAANATSLKQLKSALQGLQTDGSSLDSQFNATGLTTCGSGS